MVSKDRIAEFVEELKTKGPREWISLRVDQNETDYITVRGVLLSWTYSSIDSQVNLNFEGNIGPFQVDFRYIDGVSFEEIDVV